MLILFRQKQKRFAKSFYSKTALQAVLCLFRQNGLKSRSKGLRRSAKIAFLHPGTQPCKNTIFALRNRFQTGLLKTFQSTDIIIRLALSQI